MGKEENKENRSVIIEENKDVTDYYAKSTGIAIYNLWLEASQHIRSMHKV